MIEINSELPRAVPAIVQNQEYNDMLDQAGVTGPTGMVGQPTQIGSLIPSEELQNREQDARSRAGIINNPQSVNEAYLTSWKSLLARNLGRRVVVTILMGTQSTVTVRGILYEVGSDYLVLYQPAQDSYITTDLYSVKFVEFRVAEQRNTIQSGGLQE